MNKLEAFQAAAEALENYGYDAEVQENYSGPGMYGSETVALVTGAPGTLVGAAFVLAAWENDDHPDVWDNIPTRRDDMGRVNSVYY